MYADPTTMMELWKDSPQGLVKEGDTVELRCQGDGNPPPIYIFSKEQVRMERLFSPCILRERVSDTQETSREWFWSAALSVPRADTSVEGLWGLWSGWDRRPCWRAGLVPTSDTHSLCLCRTQRLSWLQSEHFPISRLADLVRQSDLKKGNIWWKQHILEIHWGLRLQYVTFSKNIFLHIC